MAVGAFLKLVGQSQGNIKGGVTQKGREGLIEVTTWSWGGERDGGQASGSEFHITKKRDQASPRLLNAFKNNELMSTWELDLYDGSANTGLELNTTTFTLSGARLGSIRHAGVDSGGTAPPDHDELTFTFSQITVAWNDGGITGSFEP